MVLVVYENAALTAAQPADPGLTSLAGRHGQGDRGPPPQGVRQCAHRRLRDRPREHRHQQGRAGAPCCPSIRPRRMCGHQHGHPVRARQCMSWSANQSAGCPAAQVAAGSLVLKDVAPRTMVAGSPAKVVGTIAGVPAQPTALPPFGCSACHSGAPCSACLWKHPAGK